MQSWCTSTRHGDVDHCLYKYLFSSDPPITDPTMRCMFSFITVCIKKLCTCHKKTLCIVIRLYSFNSLVQLQPIYARNRYACALFSHHIQNNLGIISYFYYKYVDNFILLINVYKRRRHVLSRRFLFMWMIVSTTLLILLAKYLNC